MSGKSAKNRQKEARRAALTHLSGGELQGQSRSGLSDSGATVAFQGSVHIGPVPAPETMREYAEIMPDAPERIMSMWERQAAHRQTLENRASWTETLMRPLGLLAAAGLAAGFGWVGWDLLKNGHDVAGLVGLVTALATLVGIFVVGRRMR